VSIVRIVTRPVRAETWRELAFLVLGLPLNVLVFGLELAVLGLMAGDARTRRSRLSS
jgi:hypothetical protein